MDKQKRAKAGSGAGWRAGWGREKEAGVSEASSKDEIILTDS